MNQLNIMDIYYSHGNIFTWIGINWIKYSQHIIIGEELTILYLSYKTFSMDYYNYYNILHVYSYVYYKVSISINYYNIKLL